MFLLKLIFLIFQTNLLFHLKSTLFLITALSYYLTFLPKHVFLLPKPPSQHLHLLILSIFSYFQDSPIPQIITFLYLSPLSTNSSILSLYQPIMALTLSIFLPHQFIFSSQKSLSLSS
jgi:hypothetical protein